MKIKKESKDSEIGLEIPQDQEAKDITDNSPKLKSKVKRPQINSARNGEPWTKRESQIDLLVPRCQNIYSLERPARALETGDELNIVKHSFHVIFDSFIF